MCVCFCVHTLVRVCGCVGVWVWVCVFVCMLLCVCVWVWGCVVFGWVCVCVCMGVHRGCVYTSIPGLSSTLYEQCTTTSAAFFAFHLCLASACGLWLELARTVHTQIHMEIRRNYRMWESHVRFGPTYMWPQLARTVHTEIRRNYRMWKSHVRFGPTLYVTVVGDCVRAGWMHCTVSLHGNAHVCTFKSTSLVSSSICSIGSICSTICTIFARSRTHSSTHF